MCALSRPTGDGLTNGISSEAATGTSTLSVGFGNQYYLSYPAVNRFPPSPCVGCLALHRLCLRRSADRLICGASPPRRCLGLRCVAPPGQDQGVLTDGLISFILPAEPTILLLDMIWGASFERPWHFIVGKNLCPKGALFISLGLEP